MFLSVVVMLLPPLVYGLVRVVLVSGVAVVLFPWAPILYHKMRGCSHLDIRHPTIC